MEVPGAGESALGVALQLLLLTKGKAVWSMCCNKWNWPIWKHCCGQIVICVLEEVISQHKECVLWVIFRSRNRSELKSLRATELCRGNRSCSSSRQWKVHTNTLIHQWLKISATMETHQTKSRTKPAPQQALCFCTGGSSHDLLAG